MLKIAIGGKANSGKDTFAKFLAQCFGHDNVQFESFAGPIKEIIMLMFPRTNPEVLYGKSELRSTVVQGAQNSKGQPLTYRCLLQELGTEVGRAYKEDVWLDVVAYKAEQAKLNNMDLFIITDVRFRNEFDFLKKSGFFMVRIKRDSVSNNSNMTHSSETEQELISDNEFDIIINNNEGLDNLKQKALKIINDLVTYS